jgi:hypothetical protein
MRDCEFKRAGRAERSSRQHCCPRQSRDKRMGWGGRGDVMTLGLLLTTELCVTSVYSVLLKNNEYLMGLEQELMDEAKSLCD